MPTRERPCLEHMQQLDRRVDQPLAHVLSLDFYWWQFKPPGAGACLERKPCLPSGWKPCLEHMQRRPGLP